MTPIDPEMCVNTGRLLTEWFEYPEHTDEDLERLACEAYGVDPKDRPRGNPTQMPPDEANLMRKINAFITKRKNRKWRHGMSQQEVQVRMNEATKMVSPDNFKFLDDGTRERTGLEVNPLWMMECLVRSGLLTPKEQVAALKELAQYTHSKAPNISHNTTTHLKPEDWLLELAKEEYQEIEIAQPKQPVEKGAGEGYEKRMAKRTQEVQALINYSEAEMAELIELVDEEWEEDPDA